MPDKVIKMPDGEVVRFPDTISDKTIADAIRQRFPELAKNNISVTEDVVKSAGSGLIRGGARGVGFVGDMMDLTIRGADYLAGTDMASKPFKPFPRNLFPSTDEILRPLESVGGPLHEAQTPQGKVTQSVSEGVGAAFSPLGAGSAPFRLMTGAGAGLGAEAGEALTGNQWGRLVGGVVGGAAPGLITHAITPFPAGDSAVRNQRIAQSDLLNRNGVQTTAGQVTGNPGLKYAESQLGGFDGKEQLQQFTQSALSRIGANGRLATSDVLDDAARGIGDMFDDAAAAAGTVRAARHSSVLNNIARAYESNTSQADHVSAVANWVDDLKRGLSNGISGETWKQWRSSLSKAMADAKPGTTRNAYRDLIGVMDDSLSGSLGSAGNNQAAQAFTQARQMWRDYLVISEAAVSGSKENIGLGLISPSALAQSAKRIYGNSFKTGGSDLGELGKAGGAVMSAMPDSGTAHRNFLSGAASLFGGAVGYGAGDFAGAGVGAVLGPAVAGRALMHPITQSWLRNNYMSPAPWLRPGIAGGVGTLNPEGQ